MIFHNFLQVTMDSLNDTSSRGRKSDRVSNQDRKCIFKADENENKSGDFSQSQ